MELTLRQRDFLDKLVELYRQARRPVHYSDLAHNLGVSRFSAYDMLRLLESKGLVRAEYTRGEHDTGPGRPSVVFVPLVRARALLGRLVPRALEQHEWVETVEHVLGHLEEAEDARFAGLQQAQEPRVRAEDDAGLLDELLAAIPKSVSPLAYSAQVLTALLLPLRSRLAAMDRELVDMLDLDREGAEGGGLDLLAGFALGATLTGATSRLSRDVSARLMEYSRTCQSHIAQMDAESRRLLSGFVREVVADLEDRPDSIRG